jgi:Sec-independent protein translocase protein TatA
VANKPKSEKMANIDFEASKQQYEYGRESVMNEVKEMELKLDAAKWVYEMAGKIKATRFTQHQSEFMTLLMLKQVKETKAYRLQYGMNWVDFCEYVGLKVRNVDIQLQDLEPFRMQFLASFADFMGDDISKIKYLGKAISAKIADFDGENIIIGEEKIPCLPEYAGEINAALDNLRELINTQKEEAAAQKKAFQRVQADTHKSMAKLEKELQKARKSSESKGLTLEEDAFLTKMEHARITFDTAIMHVEPTDMFSEDDPAPTPRMIAAYLSTLDYMRKQIIAAFDTATEYNGSPVISPEKAWKPGMSDEIPMSTPSKKS